MYALIFDLPEGLIMGTYRGIARDLLACVASVSVEQRAKKKRGFRRFARAKNGARAKIRRTGSGRGKEGTACSQAF